MTKIELDHDSFACRQEDAFAILTLKKRAQEALTSVLAKEDLMTLLSEVQANPDIKGLALLYSGEYPGDEEYKRFLDSFFEGRIDVGQWRYGLRYKIALRQFLEIVVNFSIPIVTGMHGNIGPDSFGLSLASDFRLATEGTQFVNPNVRLGLPPSGILSFFLVKNIGPAKAVETILSKSTLSARDALDLGLISGIVGEEELESECIQKLNELSVLPRNVFAEVRRLLQPDINEAHRYIDTATERIYRNLLLLKR